MHMVYYYTISVALALNDVRLIEGFVTPVSNRRTFVERSSFQSDTSLYPRGSEEDATSLDFDKNAAAPAVEALAVTEPSSSLNQRGDNSASSGLAISSSWNAVAIVASFLALLLLLPQSRLLGTNIITTYSNFLAEQPFPTKALTSGTLCGVSDVIAQFREANRKRFNFKRWLRFVGKSRQA